MGTITIICVISAWIALLAGGFSLTQATMGAGIVGVACFLGIIARLAQASRQHEEIVALLKEGQAASQAAIPTEEETE